MPLRYCSKVARALEHEELVEVTGRVDRGANAESRVTAELVGSDGLYQYDYSDPKNIRFLSKIPVSKR